MSTPTFYLNDVFIAGDVSASWSEEQWQGTINKLLPEGKHTVLLRGYLCKRIGVKFCALIGTRAGKMGLSSLLGITHCISPKEWCSFCDVINPLFTRLER